MNSENVWPSSSALGASASAAACCRGLAPRRAGVGNECLGQGPNALFPRPLARLGHGNEGVLVVTIDDARVSLNIGFFQKCLAALVDGNGLEMSEGIAHEIDRCAFLGQRFCACIGKDDCNCVE